jgi:hypothetical protein
MGGGFGRPEETVINNYYDQPGGGEHRGLDGGDQNAQFSDTSSRDDSGDNLSGFDNASDSSNFDDNSTQDDGGGFDDGGGSDDGGGFDGGDSGNDLV